MLHALFFFSSIPSLGSNNITEQGRQALAAALRLPKLNSLKYVPRIEFYMLALHIFYNSIVLGNVSGTLGRIDITGWDVNDDKRQNLQLFVNNDAQLKELKSVVVEECSSMV